jgi:glutaredoxin-related protein
MRRQLSAQDIRPEIRQTMAAFHAQTIAEVAKTVAEQRFVLVGMAQNPFVGKAKKLLNAELGKAGLTFTNLEYGSYLSAWKVRLAIKLWSGWPTFPQIFVDGVLIGGFDDLLRAVESKDFAAWIASPGAVRVPLKE